MEPDNAPPATLRCVVFDLDDTLFPERDYVFSGFDAAGRWAQALGDADAAGFAARFAARARALFEAGARGDIFNRLVAENPGWPWPADAVARMVAAYRAHPPVLTLAPEVRALLLRLRAAGRKLGVITDGWLDAQRGKVAALGLEALVDAVVYSDALGGRAAWKPSPLPFRALETALRAAPAECLYIGDNPAKDFLGARAAGWQSLRLCLPGREHSSTPAPTPAHDADFHAPSFPALAACLGV